MRYYIDTCVWIDFVEGQMYAENLFLEVLKGSIVVISEIMMNEFLKHSSYSKIGFVIAIFESKNLLESVKATKDQENEALRLSKLRNVPFGDALHSVLARDNDSILMTRDRHFLKMIDICRLKLL